ncbi:Soluble guanylate cyclase 88E [Tetrabaena socialis]|uniref:Soluble guanylate cyclase 88E n=1 Tax=Tetrabaena socialis TaxID=47790 RepID=A0A2J8A680_9CHLO|nr:Soluble guanylate cyclase 88E [Tetrabaena socialis]|eukprot:PNH08005.1 Soluble guanylate cyclase 88E [Tetrabaena socialis]
MKWLCGLGRGLGRRRAGKSAASEDGTNDFTLLTQAAGPKELAAVVVALDAPSRLPPALIEPVLEHLPNPVSLITADSGEILVQNGASVAVWGQLPLNQPQAANGILDRLFEADPGLLPDVLHELSEKRHWRGLLRRHCNVNHFGRQRSTDGDVGYSQETQQQLQAKAGGLGAGVSDLGRAPLEGSLHMDSDADSQQWSTQLLTQRPASNATATGFARQGSSSLYGSALRRSAERRTSQQAMLEALTTSTWSTMLKVPRVRPPPRRNQSAHCIVPSAASSPSLGPRAGITTITATSAANDLWQPPGPIGALLPGKAHSAGGGSALKSSTSAQENSLDVHADHLVADAADAASRTADPQISRAAVRRRSTFTWAGRISPADSRRASLSPLSRATFTRNSLLESRPSLQWPNGSGGDGTDSCESSALGSRRGSFLLTGASSIGSAVPGSSSAMGRILNIALATAGGPGRQPLMRVNGGRSALEASLCDQEPLASEAAAAVGPVGCRPISSHPDGLCDGFAFAPASVAPWSEIGGEIRAPPAVADAGTKAAAAVMLARCPASPMSRAPPAPTGSVSHAAAPNVGAASPDSVHPDGISVSLSLAPSLLEARPSLLDNLFGNSVDWSGDAPHEAPLVEQWHEVAFTSFEHPQLGRRVILVTQNDVTPRIWAERQLALVMQAEHTLLENIFPHHVIEHIAATSAINFDEQRTVPPQQQEQQQSGAVTGAADVEEDGREQDAGGSAADTTWLPPIRGETFLHLATSHAAITILFCDIQGFTPMCSQMGPVVVMSFLNDLFTRLDGLLDGYGVYKVETIGDCYVAAGGLMRVDEKTGAVTVRSEDVDPLHAYRTVQFAKALLRAARRVNLPTTGTPVRLRVGIHSGPAMSGVVGTRMPRFCLFGDTMNVASRMESTGEAGAIHISQATRDLVPQEAWEPRGGMEVKGKGLMETYFLKA